MASGMSAEWVKIGVRLKVTAEGGGGGITACQRLLSPIYSREFVYLIQHGPECCK